MNEKIELDGAKSVEEEPTVPDAIDPKDHGSLNILYFSPTPSHPQDAGNRVRVFNLASHLRSLGHTIHFVYFTQEGLDESQEKAMEAQWDSLTIIRKVKKYVRPERGYHLVDDWYQEDIGPIVRERCREFDIDVVFINYIFQSKMLDLLPKSVAKVIDTHDRFSDRHKMLQKQGIRPDFFYTVAEEEAKALNRADLVIAIQDEEKHFFESISLTRVLVLGHLEEETPLDLYHRKVETIGFIGSGNSVNRRSIEDFIQHFLASDVLKENKTRLLIAGSICEKIDIVDERIEYRGHVDEVRSFYQGVDLIINPLILGTGLKIKSVEALSYGVPIVSTEVGLEGIKSDSEFHHAKDNEALVEFIARLIARPESLKMLAEKSVSVFQSYTMTLEGQLDGILSEVRALSVQKKDKSSDLDVMSLVKELASTVDTKRSVIDFTQKVILLKHEDEKSDIFKKEVPVNTRRSYNRVADRPKKESGNEEWSRLLQNIGDDFVLNAYRTIVGREPSKEELSEIRHKIRKERVSKVEILYELSERNGKKQSQSEIKIWYRLYRAQRMPIIGAISRYFYALLSLPRFLHRILKKFSVVHQRIALHESKQADINDDMMRVVNTLNGKIKKLESQVEENKRRLQRNEGLTDQITHVLRAKASYKNISSLEERMIAKEHRIASIQEAVEERLETMQKLIASKASFDDMQTFQDEIGLIVGEKQDIVQVLSVLKEENERLREQLKVLEIEIYGPQSDDT